LLSFCLDSIGGRRMKLERGAMVVWTQPEKNEVLGEERSKRWRMKYSVKNEVIGEEWSTRWIMKYSVKNEVLGEEWSSR